MFRFFENLVDPYVDYTEVDTPPTRLAPFLMEYARPFRTVFAMAAVTSVLVATIEIGLLWYLGRLVDLLERGTPEQVWQTYGTEWILVGLFLLFLRPAIQAANTALLNNGMMPNFGTLIRWRAHRHVLRQSVGWFENDFAGRIANRVVQTPPSAGEALFHVFDALTFAVAYIVGAGIMLAGADPRLMLPLALWLILYILLIRWTIKRVGPASQRASDARSAFTGRIVDAYTNIHSVKLFANQTAELAYAKEAIDNTRDTFRAEMRLYTVMDTALTTLNGLLVVAIVGWALALWVGGNATAGVVAAATALTLRLNGMTGWIMWATTTFFRSLGIVAEGMETIAQPITLTDAPDAKPLAFREGGIRFEGVSHHYGRGSGGIDRIDLSIAPGEKVGLVGRSGAGKSTLVKLLLRFYDAESGRITIDGEDIAAVTQQSLRDRIGMVQQDSSLLHRSIRDNILYGGFGAGEDDMRIAAEQAQANDFIDDLIDPEGRTGFDAHVGERGVKLSGGQRQRVALARVILKNAPILVLDEATSALDSEVEAAIQETLYGMMEGKTVLAIAHRLSTIAHLDRIIVIDDGRIVEQGTHGALLQEGGLYASFWNRQSGGFLATEAAE